MKQVISVPKHIGNYVALGGLALVVLTAIGFPPFWPDWAIPVVGVFLGLSSIKDPKTFVIAGLALISANIGLKALPIIGSTFESISHELVMLVAPAMLVVSIRMIYEQLRR